MNKKPTSDVNEESLGLQSQWAAFLDIYKKKSHFDEQTI